MLSHPMWVRGLKQHRLGMLDNLQEVAPYVGAWIETSDPILKGSVVKVAPYVGAWIETQN